MVVLSLTLCHCQVTINTLFKHFLRSDWPQLSSATAKNQLGNVPSKIFNLKRNWPRNLRKQICNCREQVVRAGCKLLRANFQSKYQHCGRSLQSCTEENIRFDCTCEWIKTEVWTIVLFFYSCRVALMIAQLNNIITWKGCSQGEKCPSEFLTGCVQVPDLDTWPCY